MTIRNIALLLLLNGFIAVALACTDVRQSSQPEAMAMEKWQQWNAQGLNRYQYDTQRQCYCAPEYTRIMRVTVDHDAVVAAHYVDDSKPVPDKIIQQLKTINGWFTEIQKMQNNKNASVKVQYHAHSAYPQQIEIDGHARIADNEYTVTITSLQAL